MKLPRFSLRTLFLLVALIGVPMGWVASQLNWIRQRREFANRHHFVYDETSARLNRGASYPEPPWYLKIFGESSNFSFGDIADSELDCMKELFPERIPNHHPSK